MSDSEVNMSAITQSAAKMYSKVLPYERSKVKIKILSKHSDSMSCGKSGPVVLQEDTKNMVL
jgi:protein tyrosine phosphatase